ncbi:BON domain-containing protein [Indioceanicola profundi]|uniref:BON domain-containing protein n=1 Tax=Indioceanicola profundi TaxID=2220096 RepID=UPI001969558D|nr:BON domain-containing protein [Indioceanicola profundi]
MADYYDDDRYRSDYRGGRGYDRPRRDRDRDMDRGHYGNFAGEWRRTDYTDAEPGGYGGRGHDEDRYYGRDRDYGRDRNFDDRGYSDRPRSGHGLSGAALAGRGFGSRDYGSRDYGDRDYSGRDYGGARAYDDRRGRSGGGDHGDRGFFARAGDEMASWFGSDDAERRRRWDAEHGDEGAQHHRGRGPTGYKRADARISDDIHDRLTEDPYLDATDISVKVEDGEVTLSGHVSNRRDKRRAEDLAEDVMGVRHVQNNLRVREGAGFAMTGSGTRDENQRSTSWGRSDSTGSVRTDASGNQRQAASSGEGFGAERGGNNQSDTGLAGLPTSNRTMP